jgi:hypothetical protein
LYKQITGKLFEEKNRRDGEEGHQWSKRGFGKEKRRGVSWVA